MYRDADASRRLGFAQYLGIANKVKQQLDRLRNSKFAALGSSKNDLDEDSDEKMKKDIADKHLRSLEKLLQSISSNNIGKNAS